MGHQAWTLGRVCHRMPLGVGGSLATKTNLTRALLVSVCPTHLGHACESLVRSNDRDTVQMQSLRSHCHPTQPPTQSFHPTSSPLRDSVLDCTYRLTRLKSLNPAHNQLADGEGGQRRGGMRSHR